MYFLADYQTKKRVYPENFVFTGKDTPWEVVMDYDLVRSKINSDYFRKSPPLVSKYLPFMPIADYSSFVSLKEGATPLIESKHVGKKLGINLFFKLESQNPTGSFKDRGSAVELSIAKELSVPAIAVASTGNMAASVSCYAASAQIPCFVFVPEGTPPSKLSQSIAYGGHIVQVKGSYNDAAVLAQSIAEELGFYLAGDYAFRVEGQKTAAYEIIDQLLMQSPDAVFVPIGCGTNITAYGKGFREYQHFGFLQKLPRLVGVQADGAKAVVNSYELGTNKVEALESVSTICSAIGIGYPLDGGKALDAIYESNGFALAVNDDETLRAQYLLSKEEGLFVEASSATTLAALMKAALREDLRGQTIVCVLSGNGLKDPSSILRVALKPPTIHASVDEFLSLYNAKFFDGSAVAFMDRDKVIFATPPTTSEVHKTIVQHLGTSYPTPFVEKVASRVEKFLKKGKPVIFADLQDIVQDAHESLQGQKARVFSVTDFEVTTSMDKKPTARVWVKVEEEQYEGSGEGVGPVDAIVNALRAACPEKINFALDTYKVNIRSQGTDAVVYVELKLSQGNLSSSGSGTSPDIIQASIEAFEEAYNGFYAK